MEIAHAKKNQKKNECYRFDSEEDIYKKCDIDTPHCLECSYDYSILIQRLAVQNVKKVL